MRNFAKAAGALENIMREVGTVKAILRQNVLDRCIDPNDSELKRLTEKFEDEVCGVMAEFHESLRLYREFCEILTRLDTREAELLCNLNT